MVAGFFACELRQVLWDEGPDKASLCSGKRFVRPFGYSWDSDDALGGKDAE